MTAAELADVLLDYIREYPTASFAELERRFPAMHGDREIFLELDGYGDVVLWSGMSGEAAEAINLLRVRKVVELEPSSTLVYLIDGRMLGYPLVTRRKPRTPYTADTPHWLPVTFTARRETA